MTPGRNRLVVQPYAQVRNQDTGSVSWQPTGDPVKFRGNVYPLDMSELTDAEAEQVSRRVRVFFYGQRWPGGRHARYQYDGAEWDQVNGDAVHYTATSVPHWEAILERRGAADG